jgi:hypothetical protein
MGITIERRGDRLWVRACRRIDAYRQVRLCRIVLDGDACGLDRAIEQVAANLASIED